MNGSPVIAARALACLPYVISSRVRLARNITGMRFPNVASAAERQAVFTAIAAALRPHGAQILRLDTLAPCARKILQEQYLISQAAIASVAYAGVARFPADHAAILINEEDHLRIQAIQPGFDLTAAWETVQRVENFCRPTLDFAHTARDGYVTACPANAGSGRRISVMLFVPGLILTKQVIPVLQRCVAQGCTVRGAYGEGSAAQGDTVQISTQPAWPERSQEDALARLTRQCHTLFAQERQARQHLLRSPTAPFWPRLRWAKDALQRVTPLTLAAGQRLIAMTRLAVACGVTCQPLQRPTTSRAMQAMLQRLDELAIHIQPAHLRQYAKQPQIQRALAICADADPHTTENLLRAHLIQRAFRDM